MFGRTAKTAAAFMAGVMALVLLPTLASPVSAAPDGGAGAPRTNQPFQLALTQGSLLIRDAEESYSLATPTIISGQHDTGDVVGGVVPTGAVTEGVLTTPTITFETVALGLPVFVDAILQQVTPASGTGSIDSKGNVQFKTSMSVRLEIEVGTPTILTATCETSPVEIVLDSTTPYNESTDRVTLRDADFSVPPVPITPQCDSTVANNVNDLLSGGGHSLTMTMAGALVLPPKADCPTLTTLSVAPVNTARFGTDVTFTGTVTRDPAGIDTPECEGVASDAIPSGLIEFRDGSRIVGTGEVDSSGVATFTTDDLPAGSFDLVAAYRSSPPFAASESAVLPYSVTADPVITVDFPNILRLGAAPTEFDVTVTNSPLGSDITNGRLTLSLEGPGSLSTSPTIEYREDDGTWISSTVTRLSRRAFARIDPLTGRSIPKGTEVTRRVRVSMPAGLPVGPYQFLVELIQVDPVAGTPAPVLGQVNPEAPATPGRLAITRDQVAVFGTGRLTTPWSASGLLPHTIRQGQTLRVNSFSPSPATVDGLFPTGTIRVLFDGKQVPIRIDTTPPSFGYQPFLVKEGSTALSPEFVVPVDAPTGDHTVTAIYDGDDFFTPAQWSATVRVLAARGPTYTCSSAIFTPDRFTVNVEASAIIPAASHPGDEVGVDALDISLYGDRGGSFQTFSSLLGATNTIGAPGTVTVQAIDFELAGGLGSGTATAFTTANKNPMSPATAPQDPNPDAVFGFTDEVGTLALEGEPGDVIDVSLDRILMTGTAFGGTFSLNFDCVPLGDEPMSLGSITLAGAALTVETDEPARVGDLVTLGVQVHPIGTIGTVEFLDGTDSLGLAAVAPDGTASLQTDELAEGVHQLSARFYGGTTALSSTTETVVLEVLEATECSAFAEPGNGAIVRLVYMELLGRCPDQAGYDYWKGRLDDGLSVEAFARIVARSDEALGMVVADAYQTMLGRAPDPAGRAYWIGRLQGSGRYDHLLADLGASGEFWSKAGSTNEGFVTRVYERLLDRAPDQGGLDYWVGRLEGGTSRRALILSLANLDEPLGRLVALSYDEILSRVPNAGERAGGITHLRSTGDRSALYAQLMGLSEFDERAQEFPNPED